jgi:hypothetical protein
MHDDHVATGATNWHAFLAQLLTGSSNLLHALAFL